MHAFRCALSLVSLVFGEVFFVGGSASLHECVLHFLFLCLVWGCFLGAGMKGYGVFWHERVWSALAYCWEQISHTACELLPFPFQG